MLLFQVVLPLDEFITEAVLDERHVDHTFWYTKVRSIYEKLNTAFEKSSVMTKQCNYDFTASSQTSKRFTSRQEFGQGLQLKTFRG